MIDDLIVRFGGAGWTRRGSQGAARPWSRHIHYDFKRQTALRLAAKGYSLRVLKLLLARGADMAARDSEGITPLHFAYQKGVTRIIDCLIEKGERNIFFPLLSSNPHYFRATIDSLYRSP